MTTTILVVESVVLVLLTILVAGLLRSHAEILRRLHELGAGLDADDTDDTDDTGAPGVSGSTRTRSVDLRSDPAGSFVPAADIRGSGLRDDALNVSIVGAPHRTLLAFLSSGCLTCQEFWTALGGDPRALELRDDVRVVVVAKDAQEESVAALRRLAPKDMPVVLSSEAWSHYRVPGSPYFVLIDGPAGRVRGEGTGATWQQVATLLQQAADDAGDTRREVRIDRELIAHGIEPGDPSLYRTAAQIAQESRSPSPP
ncbi:MAG TPA: hypothetical protein VL119_00945 [Acidimicrobiia bacterium]|nr:hypothetical protein [Acidimicrobiia bacterium]